MQGGCPPCIISFCKLFEGVLSLMVTTRVTLLMIVITLSWLIILTAAIATKKTLAAWGP